MSGSVFMGLALALNTKLIFTESFVEATASVAAQDSAPGRYAHLNISPLSYWLMRQRFFRRLHTG